MKVMCINDRYINENVPPPVVGQVYTVLDTVFSPIGKIPHYRLNEIGEQYAYAVKHFIPLSDIDEMELIQKRETNVPV